MQEARCRADVVLIENRQIIEHAALELHGIEVFRGVGVDAGGAIGDRNFLP